MASDIDLVKLYSGRILALAAEIPHLGRIERPSATARRRAPMCGSTVTVDLVIRDGRIADFAQDVKACALGQAAASVLGAHVIGRSRAEVEAARDQLHAMLTAEGPVPDAPFEDLEVLLPAREFRNRHGSILLAFDATAEAMAEAEKAA
ncbi:iron-sulfur cluster assembly scaffold protein [Tropicimonas sp. IMCC34043]|uniref:iron-sulfur cluster assembly scaffold protein n=1 Tax=Tropicimonas sp. IMCC34043 TaxID=2248760 RepID=UPI000E2653A7|nr:iron-sulfur cluster assembly scaffold protein [Tropicimonas sp. IMCC34043]